MSRFNHDSDAQRIDRTLNRFSNLCGEALLYLQSARKYVHQAWNLTEPDHSPSRNIGDVDLAEKRQKVVFAETKHLDILDDDHLVIRHIEQSSVQDLSGILMVSAGEIPECAVDSRGCFQQPVACGVFANLFKYGPDEVDQTPIISQQGRELFCGMPVRGCRRAFQR